MEVAREILYRYLKIYLQLQRPRGKSDKAFRGYIFTKVLSEYLARYVEKPYKLILGPLWIKGLEWIEWDLAVVKEGGYGKWIDPENIAILFECKVHGVYGKRDELEKLYRKIEEKFRSARGICPYLRKTYYISLMEAEPLRSSRRGIDYYKQTKENISNSFILFNSRSIHKLYNNYTKGLEKAEIIAKADETARKIALNAQPLDSWGDFITEFKRLI